MVKDYKKKRSAPSRKRNRKVASPSGPPGWVWFIAGVAVSGFVFFLVYLAGREDGSAPGTPAPAEDVRPSGGGEDVRDVRRPEADEDLAKPRYEFYKMLPEMEVEVPDEGPAPRPRAEPGEAADGAAPASRYVLQAGSFRKLGDADRRKAELALQGFEATIQSVDVSGETWHRVRVGPFDGRRATSKARDRLLDNGIPSMIVRVD